MIGTVIFAPVRRKTADYLTENRNEKDKKKSPKLKMNFYLFKMLRFIKNILCSIILNHTKTL